MEDGYSDRFADPKSFLMESSSGSSKRTKAPGNSSITQSVSCLVDGCNSDLSHCKEYHRRHKVCELHSKAPKVTIGDREQRFCQQCSRFHSLVEFDEGKRSCRKRLDCHNRRRRKPPSELLSRNTGRFSCNLQQDSTLLSFNSPQIFPSAVIGPGCTPFSINQNDDIVRSTAQSRGEGNRTFQILMGNDPSLSEVSTRRPLLIDSSSSPRNSESSKKMLYDNRALSLLSSAPAETREIGFTQMVQPEPMSLDQSSIQNLHYSGLNQYSFSQGVESISDFNSNQNNVFENGPDGSSSSASEHHQQTLSFMWE